MSTACRRSSRLSTGSALAQPPDRLASLPALGRRAAADAAHRARASARAVRSRRGVRLFADARGMRASSSLLELLASGPRSTRRRSPVGSILDPATAERLLSAAAALGLVERSRRIAGCSASTARRCCGNPRSRRDDRAPSAALCRPCRPGRSAAARWRGWRLRDIGPMREHPGDGAAAQVAAYSRADGGIAADGRRADARCVPVRAASPAARCRRRRGGASCSRSGARARRCTWPVRSSCRRERGRARDSMRRGCGRARRSFRRRLSRRSVAAGGATS